MKKNRNAFSAGRLLLFIFPVLFLLSATTEIYAQNLAFKPIRHVLPEENVKKLSVGPDGSTWFFTESKKVFVANRTGDVFDKTSYFSAFTNDSFQAILAISVNKCYISTYNDYLYLFDNGIITKFDSLHGLNEPCINGIVKDESGLIMVSSFKSAYKFNDTTAMFDSLDLHLGQFGGDSIRLLNYQSDHLVYSFKSDYNAWPGPYILVATSPASYYGLASAGAITGAYVSIKSGYYNKRYAATDSGVVIVNPRMGNALYKQQCNAITELNNRLFVSTNEGLFYHDMEGLDFYPFCLPGQNFRANDLGVNEGRLMIGSNQGLMWIDGYKNKIEQSEDSTNIAGTKTKEINFRATDCNAKIYWDFGDGSTDSGCSVKHTFSSKGIFTIKQVTHLGGSCYDTVTSQFKVLEEIISAVDHKTEVPEYFNFFPNPLQNSHLTFQYKLKAAARIKISLHDISGRVISVLFFGAMPEAVEEKQFDLSYLNLRKGVYLLKIELPDKVITQRLVKM